MKKIEIFIIMLLATIAGNAQTVGVNGVSLDLDQIDTTYTDGENRLLNAKFPIGTVKRITFSKAGTPDFTKADNATAGNMLQRVFFTPQANCGKVLTTVEAEKSGNVFSAFIPYLTDFSQLKASFVATGDVWVEGVCQKSGITANSFVTELTYKVVSASGDIQTYKVNVYNSQLPVLKLNSCDVIAYKLWGNTSDASLSTADNSDVLTFSTQIKAKGSRYSTLKKKSYNLKTESKIAPLNMDKSKHWVLFSCNQDASLLRNQIGLAVASVLDGMAWTPNTKPIELIVGDQHLGTYYLSEQMRAEQGRIDGSSVWKLTTSAPEGDDIAFKLDASKQYGILEDADDDLDKDQAENAFSSVVKFEEALYGSNFKDANAGYRNYIDVNSFVDWLIANEVVKNSEGASEAYFYINGNGKIAMGAVDFDDEIEGNNGQSATGFAVRNSGWMARLMQDPYFAAKVAERYTDLKQDLKSAATSVLESGETQLSLTENSNEELWNMLGSQGQSASQKSTAYSKCTSELSAWLEERFKWLDLAFANEAKTAKEENPTSNNEMKSFKILKSANSDALLSDYTATITTDSIKIFVPYLVHFDLVPTFEAASGATVYVDNVEQTSGTTSNNFLHTQTYKVVAQNGDVRSYKVCIYNSGIPVVYINTPNNAAISSKDTWVENIGLDIYLNDGRVNYSAPSGVANIKGRGNSTWSASTEKRPYAVKLNEKAEILGMLEHKRWVLLANYYDASFFRNDLANYLAKKCTNQNWSPSGYNVELVLNGSHKGNYYLCEQVRLSDVREEGDYLVEADRKAGSGQIKGVKSSNYFNVKDPDVADNSEDLQKVKTILDNFENTLYGSDFLDSEKGYKKLCDMESFVDWYFIKELSKDYDGNMYTSCYCHILSDGTIKMGPIWDFDLAFGGNPFEKMMGSFGGTDYGWYNEPEGYHIADADWFVQMWKDPEFVALLRKRVDAMLADLDDINDYIDFHTRLLTLSASANTVGYWSASTSSWGGWGGWGGTTTTTSTRTFAEDMQIIKDFIKNRLLWMQEDLK